MPNFCFNSFELTGPIDKIKALWEAAQQENRGLLNAMVPMPEELRNTTAPSDDGHDWYTWSVNNWGTKWDVQTYDLELVENDNDTASIVGSFNSAWAPPIQAYDTFLEENDDCTIFSSYDEEGMSFCGIYENGLDDYHEYDLSDLSNIPEHIIEEFALNERREQWLEWNDEEE